MDYRTSWITVAGLQDQRSVQGKIYYYFFYLFIIYYLFILFLFFIYFYFFVILAIVHPQRSSRFKTISNSSNTIGLACSHLLPQLIARKSQLQQPNFFPRYLL